MMSLLLLIFTAALTQSALAGTLGTAKTSALDEVYAPRRVAVLIGVDDYSDPALTPLRFAAKDARDLGAVLESPELGDFDRVLVVTGKESTSAQGIRQAIAYATADLQRDDTFVLYLSGHGTLTIDPSEGSRLWFLPSDGQLGAAASTGLAVSWLEEQVAQVEARRRVLIMDTCHNGRDKSSLPAATQQLLASMRGEPPAPRGLREVSESEARLFAAQYYQPAMEDADLGNGVYTHFLIEALSDAAGQADLDGDGLVDVTEAHDWARDKTITYTGGMQVPRAEYRIVGREDIYLAGDGASRSAAERALLTATDALLSTARVLVDGQPRGVLPQVVPLEPGRHRIEVLDAQDNTLVDRHLTVKAGETFMVEDLLPSVRPAFELSLGAAARHGYGAGLVLPVVGLADFTLHLPNVGPTWFAPDLHVSGTYGIGNVELQQLGVPLLTRAGELTGGATAAYRFPSIPLSVGPSVNAGVIYRQYRDLTDVVHRQGAPLIAPGARATLRKPLSDTRSLTLRYDARLMAFRYDQTDWTSVVTHGLTLGVSATP